MTAVEARAPRARTRRTAPIGRTRRSLLALLVSLIAYAVLWQIGSFLVAQSVDHPEYVMPDLVAAVTRGLPGLSDYYTGVFGGTPPQRGGEASWQMGLLALLQHAIISLMRFALGLVAGVVIGVVLGLFMATNPRVSTSFLGIANLFRMMPILAMAPLFTLWFGATTLASVVFIAFVVAPIMLIATIGAVRALDPTRVEYSQALGASRSTVLWRVILPAIVPALGGALSVVVVLAWSVLLASELYGIQDGIGWMMGQALHFTRMAEVMVIAGGFILLAFVTVPLANALVRRLSVWAE